MNRFMRLGVVCCAALFVAGLPAAAVTTTWTNVHPSTVVSSQWSNADNWDARVPESGDAARLTSDVNSYIVEVDSAPTVFSSLTMSNSGDNITELRIDADMDFRPTLANGFTLSTMNQNCVMNVVSGTTAFYWSAQHAGHFRVRDGATLVTRMQSSTNGGLDNNGRMTVESGGEWIANNGGMHADGSAVVVESGGSWTIGSSSRMPNGNVSGASAIVVTNRGTVAVTSGDLQFGYSDYGQHTFYQVDGEFTATTSADLYFGCQGSTSWGRGNLMISGGLVSNAGTLFVGRGGDTWGRATWNVRGLVHLSGGEYRHTSANKRITVGGWGTAINEDKTMDTGAEETVRGELVVAGGKFSTVGNILVANGPSRGTITVSGGEFYVANGSGTASLLLGGFDDPTLVRPGIATLTVTGGYAEVDCLYATNQVGGANYSIVNLHGGELAVRSILASNGDAFEVGDGTNAATLSLLDGTHTFNDGLLVHSNATLSVGGAGALGSATVVGDVTLDEDARLAWDFNATTQDWITVQGTVALPDSATVELTGLDASKPETIPLLTATGGFTGSPSLWPKVKLDGVFYGAVIEGNTLQMTPPAGTLVTIR